MTREDLRYHMRLPSDSRAILELGSGKELPCKVHDLSLGGAYILREEVGGVIPSLRKGEGPVLRMLGFVLIAAVVAAIIWSISPARRVNSELSGSVP